MTDLEAAAKDKADIDFQEYFDHGYLFWLLDDVFINKIFYRFHNAPLNLWNRSLGTKVLMLIILTSCP